MPRRKGAWVQKSIIKRKDGGKNTLLQTNMVKRERFIYYKGKK